jgi:hypothetical protein
MKCEHLDPSAQDTEADIDQVLGIIEDVLRRI